MERFPFQAQYLIKRKIVAKTENKEVDPLSGNTLDISSNGNIDNYWGDPYRRAYWKRKLLKVKIMKVKKTLFGFVTVLWIGTVLGQGVNSKDNLPSDNAAVLMVMKGYKNALQNLTVEGTFQLFVEDSKVFESGGYEGTYKNYVAHHLGPELEHFESFVFSDYKIEVEVNLPYAFTTETYVYTIVLKPTGNKVGRTISKKGVATSILKKIDGAWKIIKTHSSSRNRKNK